MHKGTRHRLLELIYYHGRISIVQFQGWVWLEMAGDGLKLSSRTNSLGRAREAANGQCKNSALPLS